MEQVLVESVAQAFWLIILCSGIPLLASTLVGFVVSVLQAATQIQEQSLSFLPRVAAVSLAMFLCWPLLSHAFVEYLEGLFAQLARGM